MESNNFLFLVNPEDLINKFQKYQEAMRKTLANILEKQDGSNANNGEVVKIDKIQVNAVIAVTEHFNAKPNSPAIVEAPRGSGKIGMTVLFPYVLGSKKVLVVTPSNLVSKQIAAAFGFFVESTQPSFLEVAFNKKRADVEHLMESVNLIENTNQIQTHRMGSLVVVNAQKFGGTSDTTLLCQNQLEEDYVVNFFSSFDTLIMYQAHQLHSRTWETIIKAFMKPVDGLRKQVVILTPMSSGIGGHTSDSFIMANSTVELKVVHRVAKSDLEGVTTRKLHFENIVQYDGTLDNAARIAEDIQMILHGQDAGEPRFRHQALVMVANIHEADEWAEALARAGNGGNYYPPLKTIPIHNKNYRTNTTTMSAVERFTKEDFNVGIVCGMLQEGYYENPNVSLCVILRHITSYAFFQQFTSIPVVMKAFPDSQDKDQTQALILSYKNYGQEKMWREGGNLDKAENMRYSTSDDEDDFGDEEFD